LLPKPLIRVLNSGIIVGKNTIIVDKNTIIVAQNGGFIDEIPDILREKWDLLEIEVPV